jgi:membrane-associated protein
MDIVEFFSNAMAYFQPEYIIRYGGLLLLLSVVFIENGLFFGFFLPGDSLMFTAGLLTATGVLNHSFIIVLSSVIITAILGSLFGYYFGLKAGSKLYVRKDSFFFRKSHIATAEKYYERYGTRTLVIGRFLPVVRTFAPIVAGIVKMPLSTFMGANIIGAFAWVGSLISLGYFLGKVWPNAEQYLGYIIILLVIITAIPVMRTYIKAKKGTL